MKKVVLTLSIFAALTWAQTAPRPRAQGAAILGTVPINRVTALELNRPVSVAALATDAVVSFKTDEGSNVLVARYASAAAGLRLHLRNVHLPANARLFIYGDRDRAPAEAINATGLVPGSDDFWSPAIAGEFATVELQVDGEIPAALPFEVSEITPLDQPELDLFRAAPAPQGETSAEARVSIFHGVPVTHSVQEGMAIVEGDIMLGRADELQPASPEAAGSARAHAFGTLYPSQQWPSGVVPYTIDPNMTATNRVTDAIAHWNSIQSAIRLVPRTTQTAYVNFTRSATAGLCSSYIGMTGSAQPTYLGDYCSTGNVIHEIGHVTGLFHEHTRTDRDTYVRINFANVDPASAFNFNMVTNGKLLGAYDYNSIMHYPAYGFSINGLPTIETIPAGIPIGQRNTLSAGDIAGVQNLYGVVTTPPVVNPPVVNPPVVIPPAQTGTVSLTTNPPGLQLVVDGATVATPYVTAAANTGVQHTISAPATQSNASVRNTFASWSNGAAQTFTFTQTAGQTAFTASYASEYMVTVAAGAGGTVAVAPQSRDNFYASKSAISLVATPATGSCFSGWTGLLAGTPASTSLTVDKPYTITANFGSGTASIAESYAYVAGPGGTLSAPVSATGSCGLSISTNVNWISFPQGTASASSGSLVYSVARNPSTSLRYGSIIVGNTSMVVYQFGSY